LARNFLHWPRKDQRPVFRRNFLAILPARPVVRAAFVPMQIRPISVSARSMLASDDVFSAMEGRIDAASVAKVKGQYGVIRAHFNN